mmetsp:Transcript_49304/g.148433  ORF Transcript_49304/g.148433 Transcript_49304/m.148433 type:complete len:1000 (+) Transcript_49304:1585-4584(+)
MGPGGFSECGDATLWLVRRRPARGRGARRGGKQQSKRGLFKRGGGSSDNDNGTRWTYALQLIDVNLLSSAAGASKSSTEADEAGRSDAWGRMRPWGDRSRRAAGECLVASSGGRKRGRRKNREKANVRHSESLRLVPCGSDEAWGWRVDGDGVLAQEEGRASLDDARGGKSLMGVYGTIDPASGKVDRKDEARQCLHRTESSSEVGPCIEGHMPPSNASIVNDTEESEGDIPSHVVHFSLIRYQAGGAGAATKLPKFSLYDEGASSQGEDVSSLSVEDDAKPSKRAVSDRDGHFPAKTEDKEESHIPRSTRPSGSHASSPMMHPDLKPSSQLLFTNIGTNPPKRSAAKRPQLPTGTSAQDRVRPGGGHIPPQASHSLSAGGRETAFPRKSQTGSDGLTGESKKHLLHKSPPSKLGGSSSSSSSSLHDDAPHKPRKIPVHPYIAGVKSPGVWEDPQTGLEYLTDLSGYLGHDRMETGRHTLMGVGLYTRTVFNIKVYGCAYYAAKRDVLGHPGYAPFATMTAEELRVRDDFYELLMGFPSEEGAVDRTVFLKMNMQLATETMRTSLDADWSQMTTEQKNMLISSSFKERAANEAMLRKIRSKENTSRCSCGQSAPPEYEADPGCCARGTELVFTWRKNGDLELRIDGRVMDIFKEPGLGRAIFYEYLRGDEPMSMDARDHFADGFPFLLAPLAQVRGVSSPVPEGPSASGEKSKGIVRFFGNMADAVGSQASAATNWVQSGASEVVGNVGKTAKAVGDSARNFGAEMEKSRSAMVDNVMSFPEQSSRFIMSLMPFKRFRREEKVFQLRVLKSDGSTTGWDNVSNVSLQSILGGPVAQGHGHNLGRGSEDTSSPMSDEIGVIKHPTMNFTHQLFLYSVHLYLMLLLIVSVPGTSTTKLVVKRANSSRGSSDDESDESVLCSSPDERNHTKPSDRSSHLRGMELSLQLQIPLQGAKQETNIHSHAKAVDRDRDDEGRRRDSSHRMSTPEKATEMKKAFSYFL